MTLIDPALAVRLIVVLGAVNIIGLVLVLLSCRCLMGKRFAFMNKNQKFIKLYRYHCYYWWLFIISVLLHSLLAIMVFGLGV